MKVQTVHVLRYPYSGVGSGAGLSGISKQGGTGRAGMQRPEGTAEEQPNGPIAKGRPPPPPQEPAGEVQWSEPRSSVVKVLVGRQSALLSPSPADKAFLPIAQWDWGHLAG